MTIPPEEKVYRSFVPSTVEIRGLTFFCWSNGDDGKLLRYRLIIIKDG
jgi:hypothetical protein